MSKEEIHLGSIIETRIQTIGMTKTEFGRRMDMHRQNVTALLKKKSFNTHQLQKIGKILNEDFFEYLVKDRYDKAYNKEPAIKITIELPIGMNNEKEYIKELLNKLEKLRAELEE